MCIDRRDFLRLSAGASTLALFGGEVHGQVSDLPESIRRLQPIPSPVTPISDDERRARIEKARRLMVENGMSAIYIEGTSLAPAATVAHRMTHNAL